MSGIIDRFSSSFDRKDQGPNKALAEEIAHSGNIEMLTQIMDVLKAQPTKKIENDAILTLAALSRLAPQLLVPFASRIVPFIKSTNNRSVFGSMIVLSHISPFIPEFMYSNVIDIIEAMDKGTIVTRDHGFDILCHLYLTEAYRQEIFPIILEQLHNAPDNQLGQYFEKILPHVRTENIIPLQQVIESRQPYLEKEAHRKRVGKLMKRLILLAKKYETGNH